MTIKVYVNDDYEVISENQYKALINEKITGLSRNELCELFDEWFDLPYIRTYEAYDLLTVDAEKRNNILTEFKAWVNIIVAERLEEEWYEREVEV